ncbi:MAG: hypothetical protein M3Q49_22500, partial [Actinomycetota bacterium]|nr:hypothetical protein [Actinomycetota bacterium]
IRADLLYGEGEGLGGRPVSYAVYADPQLGGRSASREPRLRGRPDVHEARCRIDGDGRDARGFTQAIVVGDTGRTMGAAVFGAEGSARQRRCAASR